MTKDLYFCRSFKMVDVAQQVRASDCGSEGRGFEPHLPPRKKQSYFIAPSNEALKSSQGVFW